LIQCGEGPGELCEVVGAGCALGLGKDVATPAQPPHRRQQPPLGPPVVPHEVGGDPIEPGANVGRPCAKCAPALECHQEDLRCQVIGEILADPTRQVAVDGCEVPLEDRCEALGLAHRRRNDLTIARQIVVDLEVASHNLLLSATPAALPDESFRTCTAGYGRRYVPLRTVDRGCRRV
jgi:hypothetical protein